VIGFEEYLKFTRLSFR